MIDFRRAACVWLAVIFLGSVAPLIALPAVAEAQAGNVVLNEFLADNGSTLQDNAGEFEDWIELRNTTGSSVSLAGWTLADSSDVFTFPAGASIPGNGYLVVFASNAPERTTASQIHLPFKLSAGGEALTLRDPAGVLSTPAWPAPQEYPAQLEDDSYGIAQNGELRYFTGPTPGAANGFGVGGYVAPVTFSVEHGFFSTTQSIIVSSPTPGASIRYTTNGDVPTPSSGTAISSGSAINVSSTTVIRAIAYRDGWISSPIETRSYLFTSDIIQQGRPSGWPVGPINEQVFDYGMDPNVVNGNQATISSSLTSIPTLSIVTDLDNLFDPIDGIYVNPRERGREWERQVAVELIDPSGAEVGFDIEAGMRIRGGYSRRPENPRHSLRLYFRNDYEGALDYPLFGDEGDDRFEVVGLRTQQNYSWTSFNSNQADYVGETWSRDTQGAMGQPYTRSRPYHVYLNGAYWGLYQTQERVSGPYGESYFGGDEDDYDVVKRDGPSYAFEATDGTEAAWASLFPLVNDLQVSPTEYQTIESQVDLVNLADYYLLQFFTGDFDASPSWWARDPSGNRWSRSNNWYAIRSRTSSGPISTTRHHGICRAVSSSCRQRGSTRRCCRRIVTVRSSSTASNCTWSTLAAC